jgi:hypothetical protein
MVFRPSLTRPHSAQTGGDRMAGRLDAGQEAGQEVRLPAVPLGVFSAAGGYVEQAVRELALTLLPAVHRARQILGADGLADLQHQFCDLTISH